MTVLKAHRVSKGKASGEAVVSQHPISFTAGVDPISGKIMDRDNEMRGTCVTGKILVFPVGKGSSMGSYRIYEMVRRKTAPAAIINLRAEPIVALGAIFSGIPMVDKPSGNPMELIKTGDHVELDADRGTVKITPRQK